MPRAITVGLDGSPESRAAAEWAAREAELRGLPVKLVHVWDPAPRSRPPRALPMRWPRRHPVWSPPPRRLKPR
ncbi:universal stress protein, partial [Streptomyces sp. NPDC002586]